MKSRALRYLFDQILDLPEESQTELLEMLIDMRAQRLGIYHRDDDDREALARSAEDIRFSRFASDAAVDELFARYRA
jgi:ParB-like chromosome segregation protein Spo0J